MQRRMMILPSPNYPTRRCCARLTLLCLRSARSGFNAAFSRRGFGQTDFSFIEGHRLRL